VKGATSQKTATHLGVTFSCLPNNSTQWARTDKISKGQAEKEPELLTASPRVIVSLSLVMVMMTASRPLAETERPAWTATVKWSQDIHADAIETLAPLVKPLKRDCDRLGLKGCDALSPPTPRPTGYQLLPEIIKDDVASPRAPYTTVYSLEKLTKRLAIMARDVDLLAAQREHGLATQESVKEYQTLKKQLDNLDAHVKYHAYWQQAAVDYRSWYKKRRHLADRAGQMMTAWRSKSPKRDALRESLVEALAPFSPAKHGVSCSRSHSPSRLVVTLDVHTDIYQPEFLKSYGDAVRSHFSGPSSTRPLTVTLRFHEVSGQALFHDAPPKDGSRVDEAAHRKRFGKDVLILTTGAASHHAFNRHSVHLGSGTITPRQMAHETGHLLGFSDVYLRHFRPHAHARYGVIFTEWAGLQADLMGDSGGGRVTSKMRDRIIAAYCR